MTFNPEASAYDDEGRNKDHAIAIFSMDAVELTAQSEEAGRPVFEQREFVTIRHPGDRSYEQVEQVRDEHRKRWPDAYKAFKAGLEAPLEGTPIAEWPPINKAQVLQFQFMGIRTVEDLATLPDGTVDKLGIGGMTLRNKALAWLANARDNAAAMKAASDNDRLRAELQAMKDQLAVLGAAEAKKPRAKLALADAE